MRILCYGDSNTWGYHPERLHLRYSKRIRYPMYLQKLLGKDYIVIEEGQNARTIANDDPFYFTSVYNGKKHFLKCFQSHEPVDVLVLFLGSNDMKDYFDFDSYTAANALSELYIDKIKEISPKTKIIIVIPKEIENTTFAGLKGAKEKSKGFEKAYEELANKYNLDFVPNSLLTVGSDGLHLTKQAHENIARAIYNIIINSIK